jgi:hypothetical protein
MDSIRHRLMVATRDPNISDVEETTKGHQNDKADDVMSDDPNAKNKIKRGVKLNILISLLVLFLVVGLIRRVLPSQYSSTKSATGNSIDGYIPVQIRSNQQKNGALSTSVEKCTAKQLDIIQRQLPSEDCLKYKKNHSYKSVLLPMQHVVLKPSGLTSTIKGYTIGNKSINKMMYHLLAFSLGAIKEWMPSLP